MPRRTAAERHRVSAPRRGTEAESGSDLLDVLIAFHHPTRRWLCELLGVEGAASVGRLAARTGLAVGSVSHHLKALHRHGFVTPAPDLARDTRESWWRITPRSVAWNPEDFLEGTAGRRVADAAELENLRYQVRAIQQWMSSSRNLPEQWRRAAGSTDTYVPATLEQFRDLTQRLQDLVAQWSRDCMADREARPDIERRPVRVVAHTFPSEPVKP